MGDAGIASSCGVGIGGGPELATPVHEGVRLRSAAPVGFAGAPPLCSVPRWAGMQKNPRPGLLQEEPRVRRALSMGVDGWTNGCMGTWEGKGGGWKMETNTERMDKPCRELVRAHRLQA